MTKLSGDDVRHIAKLCRLRLTDAEVEKFSPELSAILDYIEKLQEVDTEGVEPLHQVTGLQNGLREDALTESPIDPKDLLETSPLPIVDRQIQTPSAHG